MSYQGAKLGNFRLKLAVIMLVGYFLAFYQVSHANENSQTKQYESGGIYEGEFLEGKQHGKGKYTLPNGYIYEGDWFYGKIEGDGICLLYTSPSPRDS